MLSKSKDSDKKFLAYSGYHIHTEYPHFYDMNNLNPVAIFCCNGCYYVAIDDEGSIILVPYINYANKDVKLKATLLPDGEKTCSIAFGFNCDFVLTLSGRVLMFKTQEDNRSNTWNANFIKYFPFEGLKIAIISGNLALSEEG